MNKEKVSIHSDRIFIDNTLVLVPEGMTGEEMAEKCLESDSAPCLRCNEPVRLGEHVRDTGSYNASVCVSCKGACKGCGGKDFTSLGKARRHSTTSPARWRCNDCGEIKRGITTG